MSVWWMESSDDRRFHGLDSLRGRHLKRKEKAVLGARETREGRARKLSGSSSHLFGFR